MGGVEALLSGRVGVDLANEGESAVEVGVPRDGAHRQEGRRGKGSARVDERLENPTKLNTKLASKQCENFAPRTRQRRWRKWRQNGHAVKAVSVSPGRGGQKKNAPEWNARR